jgi:DNA-binding NarL/FixJ family response regulator
VGDAAAPAADRESGLVGREQELARLDAFPAAVETGAHALVVRGEPGIGKTVLWRHTVERCRAAGHHVVLTRPAEEEMPLSAVGLVDLLESTDVDVDALRSEHDPLVRGRIVLEALRRLCEARPVIVAIDDLQWLDSVSARALRYALRRVDGEPIGVLATTRPGGHADPIALESSLPPGRCGVLDLGPLSLGALRRLLAGIGVEAVSRPTLARIHAVSGGNPLYAIELTRALPGPRQATGDVGLPRSLQTAIERRLEAVPEEVVPLLEAVSAVGTSSVREIREIMPDADVETLLAHATGHGLLVVEEDLSVRFEHPLVGSAVYARMTPLARRSLHGRLAARATDPDVRARHLALSTDAADAEIAALLEDAAGRAGTRSAHDLASEFAGHSLRLTPPADEEAARRRALLEIEHLGAAGEVRRALARADRLMASLPPGPARVEALMQRADLEDDDRTTAEALLLGALEEAGTDGQLRGRVLHRLAQLRRLRIGDLPGAAEAAREALTLAEQVSDARLELHSSAYLGHLEALRGSPRQDLMDRAVQLEQEIGGQRLSVGPRSLLAKQRLWAGDLPGARRLLEAVRADTMRTGNEMKQPQLLYDLTLVECAAGNLAVAHKLARRGIEAALDAENTYTERELLYPLALVEAWLGRADEARATSARLHEEAVAYGIRPLGARVASVLGLLSLSGGDTEAAATTLRSATDLLEEMGFSHPGAFRVLPDAVEALACSGEKAPAAELLELLDRRAEATGAWPRAAAQHARGVVLLADGHADDAAELLEHASTSFDGLGYAPDAARAMLARGRALLRGGRKVLAAEVLAEARDRFARMGAILWESLAVEELERAAPGRAAGELTAAERRIAALIAQGMRNREIGQALFMSVATVEAHLTRIYRKLGIRSRSELARLVTDGTVVTTAADSLDPAQA